MTTEKQKEVFKPMSTWLVINRAKEDKTTAGGIVLPDAAQRVQNRGIIVAIGDRVDELEVGMDVAFHPHHGWAIKSEQEGDFIAIKEEHIIMVYGREDPPNDNQLGLGDIVLHPDYGECELVDIYKKSGRLTLEDDMGVHHDRIPRGDVTLIAKHGPKPKKKT